MMIHLPLDNIKLVNSVLRVLSGRMAVDGKLCSLLRRHYLIQILLKHCTSQCSLCFKVRVCNNSVSILTVVNELEMIQTVVRIRCAHAKSLIIRY